MNKWWGYVHANGTIQAKRYFDRQDLADARESPFVDQVLGPFDATDRDDAIRHITEITDPR